MLRKISIFLFPFWPLVFSLCALSFAIWQSNLKFSMIPQASTQAQQLGNFFLFGGSGEGNLASVTFAFVVFRQYVAKHRRASALRTVG